MMRSLFVLAILTATYSVPASACYEIAGLCFIERKERNSYDGKSNALLVSIAENKKPFLSGASIPQYPYAVRVDTINDENVYDSVFFAKQIIKKSIRDRKLNISICIRPRYKRYNNCIDVYLNIPSTHDISDFDSKGNRYNDNLFQSYSKKYPDCEHVYSGDNFKCNIFARRFVYFKMWCGIQDSPHHALIFPTLNGLCRKYHKIKSFLHESSQCRKLKITPENDFLKSANSKLNKDQITTADAFETINTVMEEMTNTPHECSHMPEYQSHKRHSTKFDNLKSQVEGGMPDEFISAAKRHKEKHQQQSNCNNLNNSSYYKCVFNRRAKQIRKGQYLTSDDLKDYAIMTAGALVAYKGYQKYSKWQKDRQKRNWKKHTVLENREQLKTTIQASGKLLKDMASASSIILARISKYPPKIQPCIRLFRASLDKYIPHVANDVKAIETSVKLSDDVISRLDSLPKRSNFSGKDTRNALLIAIGKHALDLKATEEDLAPVRQKIEAWGKRYRYSSYKAAKLFDDVRSITTDAMYYHRKWKQNIADMMPYHNSMMTCIKGN